jgi:hypothetical protein
MGLLPATHAPRQNAAPRPRVPTVLRCTCLQETFSIASGEPKLINRLIFGMV